MRRITFLMILAGVFALFVTVVFAASYYRVASGNYSLINEQGILKNVRNNCPLDILVPTNTAAEFQSFINNAPACVQITNPSCPICSAYNDSGACVPQTTNWGANLYNCSGTNNRCYNGACYTCGGWMNAGYCWYAATASCTSICSTHGGPYNGKCEFPGDPSDCSTIKHFLGTRYDCSYGCWHWNLGPYAEWGRTDSSYVSIHGLPVCDYYLNQASSCGWVPNAGERQSIRACGCNY